MKKYNLEKVLHEIIRDIPGAAKVERYFSKGMIPIEDALYQISIIIREEKENNEK